ncbi:MAG TPA: nickel pincer cofactor biosynthesis protein LarC [Candidatus Avacidaminococcus intestinavium]|uniref:Pyridinium-3,5-bisthiocarboxylic acid mononucleotide nickel insertion protein n=1 Tax=Candidatus Avacidaminococcus intestinavium TaxID=2840684 RepID=A0A9D1MQ55_9FIRM|nr:nickel pincer cofactor biosynthesis protein LarC [Candidatus Avacidaminococcus intestinavium]
MNTLYIDAFSGISGNMFLGALLDGGVPFAYLQKELEKLHLGEYELIYQKVDKCGIHATYFNVVLPTVESDQHHDHHHHHHHEHRNLQNIKDIILASTLSAEVQERAVAVFTALAKAEAKVHGKKIDEVHFHEVGAIDTIIDIVGTIVALEYLKITKIFVSKLTTGSGFIKCAHGMMPVPAPATAELIKGLPQQQGLAAKELLTPTGAALIAVLAEYVADLPADLMVEQLAYGAGSWDLPFPNVVRIYMGSLKSEAEEASALYILETNLDDLTGEVSGFVVENALQQGAIDAWITPIIMKKGRPAQKISLLSSKENLEVLLEYLFNETSSLGIRYYPVTRSVATRKFVTVKLDGEPIRLKIGERHGKVINLAPEYEDCKQVAQKKQLSLKSVMQKALQAYGEINE